MINKTTHETKVVSPVIQLPAIFVAFLCYLYSPLGYVGTDPTTVLYEYKSEPSLMSEYVYHMPRKKIILIPIILLTILAGTYDKEGSSSHTIPIIVALLYHTQSKKYAAAKVIK